MTLFEPVCVNSPVQIDSDSSESIAGGEIKQPHHQRNGAALTLGARGTHGACVTRAQRRTRGRPGSTQAADPGTDPGTDPGAELWAP